MLSTVSRAPLTDDAHPSSEDGYSPAFLDPPVTPEPDTKGRCLARLRRVGSSPPGPSQGRFGVVLGRWPSDGRSCSQG